jgi:outer membrane protein assembly factor BamA
MGDLASYDAFTLGGPYSVHGYNMGELGAAHNFLEVKRWKAKGYLKLPSQTSPYRFLNFWG